MTKTINALVEALERVVSTGLDQYTHDQVMSRPDHYINAALAQARAEPAEPVHQFRKRGCADWYDGYPDHTDGSGPYTTRTVYKSPPAAPVANLDPTAEADKRDAERYRWLRHKLGGIGPDIAEAQAVIDSDYVWHMDEAIDAAIEAAHNAKLGNK